MNLRFCPMFDSRCILPGNGHDPVGGGLHGRNFNSAVVPASFCDSCPSNPADPSLLPVHLLLASQKPECAHLPQV
jgi:hypothetical protein